jgi:hypothetical protein
MADLFVVCEVLRTARQYNGSRKARYILIVKEDSSGAGRQYPTEDIKKRRFP